MRIAPQLALLFLALNTTYSHVEPSQALTEQTFVYQEELETLKESPTYKAIFSKTIDPLITTIRCDVENYKQLTAFERLVRTTCLNLGVIIVSPATMPQLYNYVDQVCKKAGIVTPTIFLTAHKKGMFNAAAQKLGKSSGCILIGQELLLKSSDKGLEAVIAHEIGHIAHNHVNKILAIDISSFTVVLVALNYVLNKNDISMNFFAKLCAASTVSSLITSLIIDKKFEKQADEFAYKNMQKGEGLIEFLESVQQIEAAREKEWAETLEIIEKNKDSLSEFDYEDLKKRHSFIKTVNDFFKWLYYKTPFGEHPSPEARIKAAQDYLSTQS